MPPCAATVCERVGNTLESTATFRLGPCQLERGAHAGAAGADHDGIEFTKPSAPQI